MLACCSVTITTLPDLGPYLAFVRILTGCTLLRVLLPAIQDVGVAADSFIVLRRILPPTPGPTPAPSRSRIHDLLPYSTRAFRICWLQALFTCSAVPFGHHHLHVTFDSPFLRIVGAIAWFFPPRAAHFRLAFCPPHCRWTIYVAAPLPCRTDDGTHLLHLPGALVGYSR